jgi:hypothetical protein
MALELYGGYMYEVVEVGEGGEGGGKQEEVEDRNPTVITAGNYERLALEHLQQVSQT